MKIDKDFFARDTRVVAKDLLGMEIVRRVDGKTIRAMIIETEVYKGFDDRASHASRGKTLRNAPMFDVPGTMYVYLIYGMHYCLNVVTEREAYPAAVLIRGIKLIDSNQELRGPGRTTKALAITKLLNNKSILTSKELYLGKRIILPKKITKEPRIGIDYAGDKWRRVPWRFLI